MMAHGYCCRVCYSAEEARGEILEYLGIREFDIPLEV